jgi:hypothetical protein
VVEGLVVVLAGGEEVVMGTDVEGVGVVGVVVGFAAQPAVSVASRTGSSRRIG